MIVVGLFMLGLAGWMDGWMMGGLERNLGRTRGLHVLGCGGNLFCFWFSHLVHCAELGLRGSKAQCTWLWTRGKERVRKSGQRSLATLFVHSSFSFQDIIEKTMRV